MTTPEKYTLRHTLTVQWRATKAPGVLAYRVELWDADGLRRAWEHLSESLPTSDDWEPRAPAWRLLHADGVAELAEWGWGGEDDAFRWERGASSTPFTDLESPQHHLVRLDAPNCMVFDELGQPLVVAETAHPCWPWDLHPYIIDVVRARAHLQNHPHVRGLALEQTMDTLEMGLIFRWSPDTETYRRAWAWCLEQNSSTLARAVAALDLLGLAAAGCLL